MSTENKLHLQAIAKDLSEAILTDGSVVPVYAAYDDDYKDNKNFEFITLIVVGPFFEKGSDKPQYINADITGKMNLYTH